MKGKLLILLLTTLTALVRSQVTEDVEIPEASTTTHETYDKVKQNDIRNQMKMVEGIEIEKFDILYIFLDNKFDTKKKFLEYFTNNNRLLLSFKKNITEQYSHNYSLSFANDNIFLYSVTVNNTRCGHLIYLELNEIKNEAFLKYFIKKLSDEASDVKIILDTKLSRRAIELFNNFYDSRVKNVEDNSEMEYTVSWINFHLKKISTVAKDPVYLKFTNELKLSEEVKSLKNEIYIGLKRSFDFLSDTIFKHYFDLEERSDDTDILMNKLSNDYAILSKAVEVTTFVIGTAKTLTDDNFLTLKSAIDSLQIDTPQNFFILMKEKFNQINFLLNATEDTMEQNKLNLLFEPIWWVLKKHVRESSLWYKKLYNLYVTASRCLSNNLHKVMRGKVDYLLNHLAFKTLNHNSKAKHYQLLEHHCFRRDIRKECILMKTQTFDQDYKLQIYGDFVNFKDIPDVEICEGRTRYMELFARDVLTIDWDLIKIGEELQVVAIAPKWFISGERKIDLTGSSGEVHEFESAEDGKLGLKGEDGLPGRPGGPGGIFIGVADEIVNKESLQIFADGGQGAPGQHGGEGGKPFFPLFPSEDHYDCAILLRRDERRIFYGFQGTMDSCFVYYFDLLTISKGGDGGNGGKGGSGGNPGQIFLAEFDKPFIEFVAKPGERGNNGLGGNGKSAVFKNMTIEEKCTTEIVSIVDCKDGCNLDEKRASLLKNGTRGLDGGNFEDMKTPDEFKGFRDIALVVNDYKRFARCYLADSRRKKLVEFYMKLMDNEVINKVYGTFGLLDELKGLENQYVNLTKKIDLLPMYNNLHVRIGDYAKHRMDSEVGDDYTVALGYAYTAALARSTSLMESDYFVSHLGNYIDSVSRNLEGLRDNIVQYTANQLSEDYKQNIERRVKEAQIMIETQLKKEVSKLNRSLKRKVYELLKETMGLRATAAKKKAELKNALLQQNILTFLKAVLVVMSALIPGGQAAAIISFTAIHIGDNLAPQYSKQQFLKKIPTAVGNRFAGTLQYVKDFKHKQHQILQKDLEFLKKEEKRLKDVDGSSNIINKAISIYEQKDVEANMTSLASEIKDLEDQIENLLQKEEEDNEDGIDVTKVFGVISRLKAVYAHKKKNTDAVEAIEDDTTKSDDLKENFSVMTNVIKKLKEYENKIYNELVPVLEMMRRDLPLDETLSVESVIGLDVSKWKVQLTLKNLKQAIKQFTEGFTMADEMSLIIEHLEDTINTLISIYNQIQNFQQEKKLVAYIKQLSNAKFRNFHSDNQVLENSMLETRLIIRRNLALIQYAKIFQAFKLLVFPYANKYMKDLYKPSIFEISSFSETDFSHWFEEISENVDKIRNKINLIQATVFRNNKFSERLEYGNKHQGEIHLWKNETDNELITDLLEGKEVILSPDARSFPHYAVKFRKIRIGLIAKNKSDQGHLTELLNPLEMTMTHEGNSYYTCGNKMYLINHSPMTFVKTFNESYQGESDSVQKLANGDDFVSPFATWRVQITKATGVIEKSYFVDFKNKVDLVLEGIGTYVQVTDTDVCYSNLSLSEYYDEYIPIIDIVK